MSLYIYMWLILNCCFLSLTNDVYVGHDFGARMSYIQVKKHGLLFVKREESVILEYPNGTVISGIACIDLSHNKNGKATIVKGGVGTNFVEIYLESERSRGLKFTVEIYTPYVLTSTVVDIDKLYYAENV